MFKIITLLLTLVASFNLFGQIQNKTMTHEGIQRSYWVYLPANYTSDDQLPLVFNLHGYGSNATEQYLYTNFHPIADTANFILCYPDGTDNLIGGGKGWNVGFPFESNTVDDVSFINALIDTMHANYNINLGRVYSCGMSNGGYMSYKLACELTDRFQAIASVTGSIVPNQVDNCMPSGTIPVMQIHGTADLTVFYNGSEIATPVEDLIAQWRDHNNCINNPDTVFIDNSSIADLTTAQYITYTDCDTDRELWFYKIIGGGHTWPGSSIIIGVTNQDFNASEEIWRFFSKYGEDIPLSNTYSLKTSTITLLPNPFVNQLTIKNGDSLIQNIRMINALGQVSFVASGVNNNIYTIDTNRLAKGSYFIEVQSDAGVEIKKVMKI